ncbi:hypothetical protein PJ985_01825 [Streptomyces sp. ACA25]|uniref:hypothetical protein n=1 Tax=Streptomyces sp. ACA25 TaxID=3022596 RepID=UPI002306EABE|nr:hypothetical protein [Streptomyces sp. ACA25]MDB1086311.1 hypothetical protein [Streptomyces sp. ACA25]
MSGDPSRHVVARLRSVTWDDWSAAFDHANSRALLMREYLRRAALWARAYGAEDAWPFLDLAEYVDPDVRPAPDVEAEVEELLRSGVGRDSVKRTCRGAVRWAALRASTSTALPDLPEPYEPLLLMYERGGGFYLEEMLDLNGVSIQLGDFEHNLGATPFLTLEPATLDALDAEGQITYHAKIGAGFPKDRPRGIVRRRIAGDGTYDEAFTRNLRWEPTEYLRRHELGHNEVDHVRITEREAAAFIEEAIRKLSR